MRRKQLAFSALCLAVMSPSASATDFVVTNTAGSGPGSLYQAITDANNTAGADRILFNIPGAGVHKIDVLQNALPTIGESLVIDGYSQPGAQPNSRAVGNNAVILIQIDGGTDTQRQRDGLIFSRTNAANSQEYLPSDYTVRGLSLTGFLASPIPTGGIINAGGLAVGSRGVDFDSLVVTGNFIGLLPDGVTARGNSYASAHATLLGGRDAASRNVISGNTYGFIAAGRDATIVEGNYFGTNAGGTKALPNNRAITMYGDRYNTIIGGTAAGSGNLISGNLSAILIGAFLPSAPRITDFRRGNGVRIKGNLIGVQSDGVTPLPNELEAITILGGDDNVVGGTEADAGNLIAFNGAGVGIAHDDPNNTRYRAGGVRNRILSNAIYGNKGLGIDIGRDGPTRNDVGDADEGSNNHQNTPVILSADVSDTSVTIRGTLNSTPNDEFKLQYFAESLDLARPKQSWLGSRTIVTNGSGNAQFTATFPLTETNVGFNMTATSVDGNTSEFALNPSPLRNISTRAVVRTGDHIPIAGFIVRPPGPFIVVRALGPSLRTGATTLPGALADPVLELYNAAGTLIHTNDNWKDDASASSLEALGFAPASDLEAATLQSLSSGAYTAVVRGAQGSTGISLVEIYDVSPQLSDLENISTRGVVGTGDDVMIAGTILEQAPGSTRLVVRALGPSLAAAGITDPLADPVLELRDSQGVLIAANDDWRDGQPEALMAVGLAPTSHGESAIFMRVAAGAYTAIVRGKGDATGVGLVEIYNLH